MAEISETEYKTLLRIQNLYKQLNLDFPDKYSIKGSLKKCFSTKYYMNNEIADIDTLRNMAKFKQHIHSNNPYSPYNKVTETVLRNLCGLLKIYSNRSIGHRADIIRYILIYENIEAILAINQSDLTPYSMKLIMSRCLLYKQLGFFEKFFYLGIHSKDFADTFKEIYEEVRVAIFRLLMEFISQSHCEKIGNIINILTTYKEYIFLYSTSSDILSTEEDSNELDVNHLNFYLDKFNIGSLSLSKNQNKNRYSNLVRFTKQIVKIMEKEFYIKSSSFKNRSFSLEEITKIHIQIRDITSIFCKTYDSFIDNCLSKKKSKKYSDNESQNFRDLNLPSKVIKGIKSVEISESLLAYFCRGFLISSSLGNFFDGEIKSGFLEETLQKPSENKKFLNMLNYFISPLIRILKNYIKISANLIELRIYRDFYIYNGELCRKELRELFLSLTGQIKNAFGEVNKSMSDIKAYFMEETKTFHNYEEINAIFNALNIGDDSYNSQIINELEDINIQNELFANNDLIKFKDFFTTKANSSDMSSLLSIFGMEVKNKTLDKIADKDLKVKINKWISNSNEEIYSVIKTFLDQAYFTKKTKIVNNIDEYASIEFSDQKEFSDINIPNILLTHSNKKNIN